MNPRFPTSARYRRHPRNKPLFRILAFGLVIGSGLFFLFRSKDPTPVESPMPPQEQANRSEQPLRSARPDAHAKAEARPENKPDVKLIPPTEVKPALVPVSKPVASPDKPDLQAAIRPSIKPDLQATIRPDIKPDLQSSARSESKPEGKSTKSGNTQEVKLEIRPETKPEPKPVAGKKGEAKADAAAKAKTDAPAVPAPEAKKLPPLPQPKAEEEDGAAHPLPDTLPPKLREQEMKLTFYKGLAMKKMILPEEPTGKKVVPPFLAGVTPIPTEARKGDGTTAQEKGAVKPVSPRPDAQKPTAESKKPPTEAQKALPDAAKPAGDTKKKSYQVQIAILSDNKNATAMVDKLRSEGANHPHVSVIKYESGRSMFRVRLGPFASQADAAKAGQRWQAPGQPALVLAVEE
ncbi:MAG: SPOR domain-containing protein [Magnetococcales bacterium]|nr:SPOR domain-containing protein [Magnetococcales bacterium]